MTIGDYAIDKICKAGLRVNPFKRKNFGVFQTINAQREKSHLACITEKTNVEDEYNHLVISNNKYNKHLACITEKSHLTRVRERD